jgi:PPM family protein phosphatase
MTLALRYAARSDVGLIRPGNEDSGYAGPRLLVVADGMGGHAAGELASAAAVATLAEMDAPGTLAGPVPAEVLPGLAQAVDDAGDQISVIVADDPELAGMGTTVTALYWQGERISLVHVGDSRAYLLRDGQLTQLSHDHTYVQTLVDSGRITEQDAATHPRRNLLMRALDGVNPVEPDLSVREARVGDRYLLATDGLTGVVPPDDLAEILREGEPTITVTRLVERALEGGAPDNVTVVVADVVDLDDDAARAADEVEPVVVGAAGEPRVRDRLPRVHFPADAQPDPDRAGPDRRPGDAEAGDGSATGEELAAAGLPDGAATRTEDPNRAAAARVRRRRAWTIALVTVAVVLAGVVGVLAFRAWTTAQWYVAPDSDMVAIYNGIPGALVGIPLQRVETVPGPAISALPVFDQELVGNGIPAIDRADADRIVVELQRRADACLAAKPPVGCPVATAAAPTASATPSPAPSP